VTSDVFNVVKQTNSTGAKPHSIMCLTYTSGCTVPATQSAQLPPPPQLELGSRIMSHSAKIPPGFSMSNAFLNACRLFVHKLKTPLLMTMSKELGFIPDTFSNSNGSSALSTRAWNTLARAFSIWQMLRVSCALVTIASVKSIPMHVAPALANKHMSIPDPHPRSSTKLSDPTILFGVAAMVGMCPTGHADSHTSSGSMVVS